MVLLAVAGIAGVFFLARLMSVAVITVLRVVVVVGLVMAGVWLYNTHDGNTEAMLRDVTQRAVAAGTVALDNAPQMLDAVTDSAAWAADTVQDTIEDTLPAQDPEDDLTVPAST